MIRFLALAIGRKFEMDNAINILDALPTLATAFNFNKSF
jgi:hypothetical protein